MSDDWKDIYLYSPEYTTYLNGVIDNLVASKPNLDRLDFQKIDILHPSGHDGVNDLLARYPLAPDTEVFDIGCGVGGTSRYFVSLGHKVFGVDVLPNFIQVADKITLILGMQDRAKFEVSDIITAESLPKNTFGLALLIGVLLNIPQSSAIQKVYDSLKPGGILYIEDYYVCKEEPLTDEETALLHSFHRLPFRTKNQFIRELEEVGFRIEELEEYSNKWSEFAWNRAERINAKHANENLPVDGEFTLYGLNCPKILSHVNQYSETELAEKFPHTYALVGSKYVYENKLLRVLRFAAFKP